MATLDLRGWAARCRHLASTLDDQHAITVMMNLARELETAADQSGVLADAHPEPPVPSLPGKAGRPV
jgi:hypothetical protein